jgi:hypothetical protein
VRSTRNGNAGRDRGGADPDSDLDPPVQAGTGTWHADLPYDYHRNHRNHPKAGWQVTALPSQRQLMAARP